MKTHIWSQRAPDPLAWYAHCGRIIPNAVQSVMPKDATCLRCLRSARDRSLRFATREANRALTASERLDALTRKKSRRKARRKNR